MHSSDFSRVEGCVVWLVIVGGNRGRVAMVIDIAYYVHHYRVVDTPPQPEARLYVFYSSNLFEMSTSPICRTNASCC